MRLFHILLLFNLLFGAYNAQAQEKKTDFNIRAGLAVGGTSPIGFPASIRKIERYSPGLLPSLEAGATYHFSKQWALASALRFEQKGMTTEARVKGYYTTFNAGDRSGSQSITGYYTGNVRTVVKNGYLTLPVHIVYNLTSPLSVRAGAFASLLLEKNFSGLARNGYLRDQTPVGEKEEIDEAAYDFSDQVQSLNAGVEIGADYRVHSHLTVSALVNWGLTPVMKSDFQSIDFKLYNLFLNLGVRYHF